MHVVNLYWMICVKPEVVNRSGEWQRNERRKEADKWQQNCWKRFLRMKIWKKRKVMSNKGSAGIDRMTVSQLPEYIANHKEEICEKIRQRRYKHYPSEEWRYRVENKTAWEISIKIGIQTETTVKEELGSIHGSMDEKNKCSDKRMDQLLPDMRYEGNNDEMRCTYQKRCTNTLLETMENSTKQSKSSVLSRNAESKMLDVCKFQKRTMENELVVKQMDNQWNVGKERYVKCDRLL